MAEEIVLVKEWERKTLNVDFLIKFNALSAFVNWARGLGTAKPNRQSKNINNFPSEFHAKNKNNK